MIIETQRTTQDLREQAKRCGTARGAAILCCIAGWLEGKEVVEDNAQPYQFVDRWVSQDTPARGFDE